MTDLMNTNTSDGYTLDLFDFSPGSETRTLHIWNCAMGGGGDRENIQYENLNNGIIHYYDNNRIDFSGPLIHEGWEYFVFSYEYI